MQNALRYPYLQKKNARQSENKFGIVRGLFNIKLNTYSLHTRIVTKT